MNIKRRALFTGRNSKEGEDIHIRGIDIGRGWRTRCGSHPQRADRVDELEKSVWSVVQQKNQREDKRKGVQDSGRTGYNV